jgi:hypothetical protein
VDFKVVDQRLYALDDVLGHDKAAAKAEELKGKAFGALNQLFLMGKKDDITVAYIEKRYEPFWHIIYRTHMEYNRSKDYSLPLEHDVKRVSLDGKDYEVGGNKLSLSGVEYCISDISKEVFIDAVSGKDCRREKHVSCPKSEIKQTEELMSGETIVVPAKIKASYLTRNALSEMLKPVSAEEITVEDIRIEKLHLYFAPVYAFEYQWASKNKTAIIEFDAVTGEFKSGGITFKQKMTEMIAETDLFDIGVEAVNLVVPGGGLAMKLARSVVKKR